MSIVASYGQQKNTIVETIERYRKTIDEDTTVKWTALTKEQMQQLSFVTDAVTVFSSNDTVIKVSEWILHPPMKRVDYYFQGEDLILSSFFQESRCSNKDFFFSKKKLIKVVLKDCNRYKNEDNREKAKSMRSRADEFLVLLAVRAKEIK